MGQKPKLLACLLAIVLIVQFLPGTVVAENDFAGGEGTEVIPFLISSPEQLNNVRNYLGEDHADKYFKLTSNIDLGVSPWNEGSGWEPIGNSANPFTGNFDGNGQVISNLYINLPSQSWVGLFGSTKNADIRNLGVVNVDITGDTYVGGLVGRAGSNIGENFGSITGCYVTGNTNGQYYVGGLVGQSYDHILHSHATSGVTGNMYIGGLMGGNVKADIESCYALGDVTGSSWFVGGLVGRNDGYLIKDSYASGSINGEAYVGGLMGDGSGSIIDSFATGAVTGTGSYSWNIGGLAGGSGADIERTYATGAVNGDDYVGGLVGQNVGNISNSFAMGCVMGSPGYGYGIGGLVGYNRTEIDKCFATGSVGIGDPIGGLVGENIGTVSNSFWDIETTGQSASYGGTGKSTTEMKEQETFATHGWNFVEIWAMDLGSNCGYPYLQSLPVPFPAPGTLGQLNIGDRVVDPAWKWQYRLGLNYTQWEDYPEAEKPVTWIVVAKDHYDIGTPHVTLMSEDLIGRHPFDDSTNRGSEDGSNHWGNSGSFNAEHGLRTFLRDKFYKALSFPFRKALLSTPLPNAAWDTGASYTIEDNIFILSQTELGDGYGGTHEIGKVLPYFDLEHAEGPVDIDELVNRRKADLPKWSGATGYLDDSYYYFTRSPSTEDSDVIKNVTNNGTIGYFIVDSVTMSLGMRPAINLPMDMEITNMPNVDGAFEFISEMEEYRIAYIPVKYPDEDSPQPEKSVEELKLRAKWVEDYFFQQSYGRVLITSDFVSEGRVELRKPKEDYAKLPDIVKEGIALAGFNSNDYDAAVVIAPGDWGRAFALTEKIPGTDPIEQRILNQVYVEDGHSFGVWAHELGHAVFKWFDYYEKDSYTGTRGNTKTWGLMGYGTHTNPPGMIVSFHKEAQGWVNYQTITDDQIGYYDIPLLDKVDFNDTILRLDVENELVDYYIFEGRHPAEELLTDDLLDAAPWGSTRLKEEGVKIFQLQERDGVVMYFRTAEGDKVGYDVSGTYMFTLPNTDILPPLNRPSYTTLRPGETYYDDPSGLYFDAVKQGSKLQIGVFRQHIYDRLIIALKEVRTHYPLDDGPDMDFFPSSDNLEDAPLTNNYFDVDLRVHKEGQVMGMDYETGEYLREIPDARTSGNILGGGPEWISVPGDLDVSFEIDTTPALRWMEELDIQGLDIEVVVLHIIIDENGNRTTEEELLLIELRLDQAFTPVTGISLDHEELTLVAGAPPAVLEAMVEPEGADNTVIWRSSNEAVATVVDGVVTPLSPGVAVISATTEDGGFVAECNVTVRALEGWTLTKTADPLTLTLGRGESKTIEYTVITTNTDSEVGTMLLDYYLELNGVKAMWSEAADGVLSIGGFEFTRVPEYSGPLTPPDHMEGGTQSYYVTVKNVSAIHDETFGLVNEASLSAGDTLVDAVTVTTVITTPGELPRTGGYPYYTLGLLALAGGALTLKRKK